MGQEFVLVALNPAADLDTFFDRLARAKHRALLLDYDGTLAPFRADRGNALPYPEIVPVLAELCRLDRVVIISGRTIADLETLLGVEPLPELWGSHGWEHRTSDGNYNAPIIDATTKEALEQAIGIAQSTGLPNVCEVKPAGIAAHWRGLATHDVETVRGLIGREWPMIAQQSRLELHEFDGGVELRIKGRHKGHAVEAVLSTLSQDAVVAFLGDDRTDEDAFHALAGRGLRVLVREALRPTAADIWIKPPEELVDFLNRWKAAVSGSDPGG